MAEHSGGSFDQSAPADGAGPDRVLPDPLPADPMPTVKAWFDEARRLRTQPNPNAMTLATADADGRPGARIVLCKQIDAGRGFLVFYTNYQSRKAVALDATRRAAAVFHWDHLDRQVRAEGLVVRSPAAESDAYFASRPWSSRIGAWASEQSRPIGSREALRRRVEETMRRFGLDPANPPADDARVTIPRPPHWGGYRLWAERVELWVSGAGRLHDRVAWTRTLAPTTGGEAFVPSAWSATRVQP